MINIFPYRNCRAWLTICRVPLSNLELELTWLNSIVVKLGPKSSCCNLAARKTSNWRQIKTVDNEGNRVYETQARQNRDKAEKGTTDVAERKHCRRVARDGGVVQGTGGKYRSLRVSQYIFGTPPSIEGMSEPTMADVGLLYEGCRG